MNLAGTVIARIEALEGRIDQLETALINMREGIQDAGL